MLSKRTSGNRVPFPCVTCRACELVRVKLACGVRVCLESVSRFSSCCCSCCCSRPVAPLVSRWFPDGVPFIFSIFFHFSAAVRCRVAALASGRHSPNLLVSNLVGLTGVEITNKGDAHTFAVWYTSVGPRATGEPCCDTRHSKGCRRHLCRTKKWRK